MSHDYCEKNMNNGDREQKPNMSQNKSNGTAWMQHWNVWEMNKKNRAEMETTIWFQKRKHNERLHNTISSMPNLKNHAQNGTIATQHQKSTWTKCTMDTLNSFDVVETRSRLQTNAAPRQNGIWTQLRLMTKNAAGPR